MHFYENTPKGGSTEQQTTPTEYMSSLEHKNEESAVTDSLTTISKGIIYDEEDE